MGNEINNSEVEKIYKKLNNDAESGGYHLNPDNAFTKKLIRGLLINKKRYGYQACPCRLASGIKKEDMDIICPCDYRDPDLDEYGTCYCALYVDEEILEGKKKVGSIPERRYKREGKEKIKKGRSAKDVTMDVKYPVWRCRVCGYLCARENPPSVCPICKAKKERFEIFIKK